MKKMAILGVLGGLLVSCVALWAGEVEQKSVPATPPPAKRKKAAKMCEECGKAETHCECGHAKVKTEKR